MNRYLRRAIIALLAGAAGSVALAAMLDSTVLGVLVGLGVMLPVMLG